MLRTGQTGGLLRVVVTLVFLRIVSPLLLVSAVVLPSLPLDLSAMPRLLLATFPLLVFSLLLFHRIILELVV